jgi:hypothetical protein
MANRYAIAVHKKTGKPIPKVKRIWHYVQNPATYEVTCPKCGGNNIEWSEWAEHLWCYSCQKDFKITVKSMGVFSGPIPMEVSGLLGMCFDRWDMEKKKFIVWDEENKKDVYLSKKEYVLWKRSKCNKKPL